MSAVGARLIRHLVVSWTHATPTHTRKFRPHRQQVLATQRATLVHITNNSYGQHRVAVRTRYDENLISLCAVKLAIRLPAPSTVRRARTTFAFYHFLLRNYTTFHSSPMSASTLLWTARLMYIRGSSPGKFPLRDIAACQAEIFFWWEI